MCDRRSPGVQGAHVLGQVRVVGEWEAVHSKVLAAPRAFAECAFVHGLWDRSWGWRLRLPLYFLPAVLVGKKQCWWPA